MPSARGSCAGRASSIGLTRSFTIYDRADQLTVIKNVLRRLDLDDKRFAPTALLAFIGQRKDEMADPATARRQAGNFWEETGATVYEAYQRELAEADAVDFDDLLLRVVLLFEQHPDVLARYQRRWSYLLVDEYQDTNRVQYRLCRLLSAVHRNLAVVGDDDQSIYSWRGADLRNILDFEQDWPDAKVVKLEQNYRSTQTILDAAHAVVSRLADRKDKRLWTDRGAGAADLRVRRVQRVRGGRVRGPPGGAPGILGRPTARLVGTARHAGRGRRPGPGEHGTQSGSAAGPMRFGDIAVAYRVNAQSRVLEEAFMRFGIPYQLVGGVRFYERREVKDALAYARLARNPADRVALERVVNVPPRGIGDKTVSELRAWADGRGRVGLGRRASGRLQSEPRDAVANGPGVVCRARAGAQRGGRVRTGVGRARSVPASGPGCGPRSRTAPRRARSGGRTWSSCGTTPPSSTRSPRPRASPASWRKWPSSRTRTRSRSGRTGSP